MGRLGFALGRTGVLALGIDVSIDEFDHGHRRIVAVAEAGLDDARIAALAVGVPLGDDVEQPADLIEVAHLADRLINAANLKRAHALLESGTSRGKIVLEGW